MTHLPVRLVVGLRVWTIPVVLGFPSAVV